jgi:hypothetical protein
VAASGIAGRFLQTRVHRGMHGEQTTLRELQMRAGFAQADTRNRLEFAPRVETLLREFEARELRADVGWLTHLRQVLILPWQQTWTYLECAAELKSVMRQLAAERDWDDAGTARRERELRKLVRRYLLTVVRIAQFTAYERVFALWHVAHVPIVYLLVGSAVVHVVAVHAY